MEGAFSSSSLAESQAEDEVRRLLPLRAASLPCPRPILGHSRPNLTSPLFVLQALTGAKRKSPEEPDEDAGAANAPHLHAIGIFMPLNEPRCVEPRASSHLPLTLCHCRRAPNPPPSAQMCQVGPTRWPRR